MIPPRYRRKVDVQLVSVGRQTQKCHAAHARWHSIGLVQNLLLLLVIFTVQVYTGYRNPRTVQKQNIVIGLA